MAAPRVTTVPGAHLLSRYESARSPLDLGPRSGPVAARSRVAYVPAAALVARTDALRATGGFDEQLSVGEDVDLCWRLADAGGLVWYAGDDAWVTHDDHAERPSAAAWARRRFEYGTSAAPLDQRHPGAVAPLSVSGWSVAAWASVVAGQPGVTAAIVAGTAGALVRKLDVIDDRRAVAALALRGHLGAGELIGRALVRPWFPITTAVALGSRRARRVALAAAVVPPLLEWRRRRPPLDPVRWTALSLVDDVAYSAGVWASAWRARSAGALKPDLRDWPGRQRSDLEG